MPCPYPSPRQRSLLCASWGTRSSVRWSVPRQPCRYTSITVTTSAGPAVNLTSALILVEACADVGWVGNADTCRRCPAGECGPPAPPHGRSPPAGSVCTLRWARARKPYRAIASVPSLPRCCPSIGSQVATERFPASPSALRRRFGFTLSIQRLPRAAATRA
jgi:hypothetical protein